METGSIPPQSTGQPSALGAGNDTETRSGSIISADFETFLKMLTTQMENQDPLNPVDAGEYASQLAMFSSVEQQVLTNDLLKDMTTKITDNAFQAMASWIGNEALAEAPVRFNGAPITLRPAFADGAESAKLVVRDAEGNVVRTMPLDMSQTVVSWAGTDGDGATVPDGIYAFTVESYIGGELSGTDNVQAYNPILEVRQQGDAILLTLSDGTEVNSLDVTALRSGSTE